MTQRFPLVSIITVNYNGLRQTIELLNSLKWVSYPSFEVIVVDNGSTEDCTTDIKARFHEAKVIRSAKNLGFAGGNNLGMQSASGKYFMLLNNDTEVEPDFLGPLVQLMEDDNRIGIAAAKLRYHHSPSLLQYAGASPLHPITLRNASVGYAEEDTGQHDQIRPTYYGHGAAMMVSRQAFEDAGAMPEEYFLYYEELDWCERIREAGYEIYFQPRAMVYHKESLSVGKLSALQVFYKNRNRVLFAKRNRKGFARLSSLAFLFTLAIPSRMLRHLSKLEFVLAKAAARAWVQALSI